MIRYALAAAWVVLGAVALAALWGPGRPPVPVPPGYAIRVTPTTLEVR